MTPRSGSHTRQTAPNRRYRRLLPAALVTATVAAGLPLGGPPPARADTPKRIHAAPPQVHKAVMLRGAVPDPRSARPPAS